MESNPTLHDEFSFTGHWWLPDKEDDKWFGTLSFQPGKVAKLELFVDTAIEWLTLDINMPRVLGSVIIEDKVPSASNIFTLLNCVHSGSRSQSSITKASFNVNFVIRGLWYSLTEEIRFKSANVEYSSLTGWMPHVVSIASEMKQDSDLSLARLDARYEKTPSREIRLPSFNTSLFLNTDVEGNTSFHEIHLRQSKSISIVPDTKQSLKWFVDQIFVIRDLLSLLSGLHIEPKVISAVVSANDIANSKIDLTLYIYRSVRLPKVDESTDFGMPFPIKLLGNQAQQAFRAWFDLSEDERVPYSLCLDVINNEHGYMKFEFLALVQALESHHQLYFEHEGRKRKRYKTKEGKVKKNGPDLMDRLKELREHFPEDPVSDDDFLNSVKDSRHYYTHYNPKKRIRALKDAKLYAAISRLVPLVAYFLYHRLNISDEIIFEAFKKVSYRGLWQRPIPKPRELEQGDEQRKEADQPRNSP